MSLLTDVLLSIATVMLLISALIVVGRIAHGPSQLDRSAAADLMVAIVIAGIGLWASWTHRTTELNVLLLLSMLGFTSAVAVARMVADRRFTRTTHPEATTRAQEQHDE